MTVYDMLGKPITIGSVVAYPARRRSKLFLRVLEVDRIEIEGDHVVLIGPSALTQRRTRTKNLNNCVRINAKTS